MRTVGVIPLQSFYSTFPPWGLLGCGVVFSQPDGAFMLRAAASFAVLGSCAAVFFLRTVAVIPLQSAIARIGRRRSRLRVANSERANSRLGVLGRRRRRLILGGWRRAAA